MNAINTRSSKLVGITGCTNGGKTTLSKRLIAKYPNSYYLSQVTDQLNFFSD